MRLFRHVDPTFNRLAPTKNSKTLSDSVTSLNRLGMSSICAFPSSRNLLAHAVWPRQHRVDRIAQSGELLPIHALFLPAGPKRRPSPPSGSAVNAH
jgi:hypothetical protein